MLMLERYKGMTCRVDFKAPNAEKWYEFRGVILSTQNVEPITLPGPSLAELEQQFKAAVDAYLEMEPTLSVVCDIGAPDGDWPGYKHTCDLVYGSAKVGKLTRLYDGKVTAQIGAYNNMSPVYFIGDNKKDVMVQVQQHFIKLEEQQQEVIAELVALQPSVTCAEFRYIAYGYTMWLLQTDQSLDTALQKVVDGTPIEELLTRQ